ncbi:MAG: hypothetical protein ACI4CY_03735 [Candidatus Gastranaerophilaceae bacterium]
MSGAEKQISKVRYKKLVKECLRLIEENRLLFVSDLIVLLPFSKTTFYVYGLDKSEEVKEAFENNKTVVKQELRSKWYNSSTPALQIALYKILATPEERRSMSNTCKEAKNDGMSFTEIQKAYLASLESMNEDSNAD